MQGQAFWNPEKSSRTRSRLVRKPEGRHEKINGIMPGGGPERDEPEAGDARVTTSSAAPDQEQVLLFPRHGD